MPETVPPAKRITKETPSIQSLDRGLLILETVGKSETPVSLGALTGVLGIDRSSVFRLANTLKRRGFLANPAERLRARLRGLAALPAVRLEPHAGHHRP